MKRYLLLVAAATSLALPAQAELVKDGVWLVQEGDSLSKVLKTALPDEPLRQKRLKRIVPLINKQAFAGRKLVVGASLRLPGVMMPKAAGAPTDKTIGRVLISGVSTIATSADGEKRKLRRGAAIYESDTVATASARTQIRFSDGSLVALRPNSEFKIEEYAFNGKQDGSERGLYSLVKGGFRTVSGLIGKVNKSNYRVKTPVATIGIRGTHYGLTLCAGGSCAAQGLDDGLYGGVVDGSIEVSNQGGRFTFDNDQYFQIAGLDQAARALLGPPGVIFESPDATVPQAQSAAPVPEAPQQAAADAAAQLNERAEQALAPDYEGTRDSGVVLHVNGLDVSVSDGQTPLNLSGEPAPAGTVLSASFVTLNDAEAFSLRSGDSDDYRIYTNASGDLVAAARTASYDGNTGTEFIDAGDPPDAHGPSSGSDSSTGLHWGRWDNIPVRFAAHNGDQQIVISNQPDTHIHFALADTNHVINQLSQLDGVREALSPGQSHLYGDYSSGSRPVDMQGISGQHDGAYSNLMLDFNTNQITELNIAAIIEDSTYELELENPVALNDVLSPDNSIDIQGSCVGGGCGNTVNLEGEASFIFASGGASGGGLDSPSGGGGTLHTAVTYAAEGLNDDPVNNGGTAGVYGIAGVAVFNLH